MCHSRRDMDGRLSYLLYPRTMRTVPAACLGWFLAASLNLAEAGYPSLPRSNPEAQGVSSVELLEWIRAADDRAAARLQRVLSGLGIPGPEGAETSARFEEWVGRRSRFESNPWNWESLSLTRNDDGGGWVLTVRGDGRASRFPCAFRNWMTGRADLGLLARAPLMAMLTDEPVAARVAWPEPAVCAIKICAYETPFSFLIRLELEGDHLTVEGESNVAFGPSKWPVMRASAE